MPSLSQIIVRHPTLALSATAGDALAALEAQPNAPVLVVVDGGAVVGLVARQVLSALSAVSSAALHSPISSVMTPPPLSLPSNATMAQARMRLDALESADWPTSVVVTQDGAYLGIVAMGDLIRNGAQGLAQESELISAFSTNIRDRMSEVLGLSQHLAAQALSSDSQVLVAAIDETLCEVRDLVDRGMTFHRAALGAMILAPGNHRIQPMMDEVESRWLGRAAACGATLLVSFDGDPDLRAHFDAMHLGQLFDALIDRALRATRVGGVEVSLEAHAAGQNVMISGRIRDGGAAASHDLTRLLEGAAALDHGGDLQSGIDLMLAQAIVAAMDGQIHVEANQGPGVTITFELRTDAARQEDRQQSANALTKEARAAHILIVDDNATNRMVAETLCEMFGCTSEEAVDGVEAVEAATRRNFDLVLMDIRMPRMDGVTATRTIRALAGRAGQVPIIALTANADPEDISAYLAAGMNAVVEKPIKPEVLLAAIEDALSSPEAISRAA